MKRLVLERRAILNNLEAVKRRSAGAVIYAVLTGDAYGAGLVEMAKLLAENGVNRFAISEPEDGVKLRKAGLVEEELLMLRSTVNRDELECLMDQNVVCSIGSLEAGMALNALAESRSTVAEAHVQVDSGMGYGGFVVSEPDKILSAFQNLQNVAICGMYTQVFSGRREKAARGQLEEFLQVTKKVQGAGFETGILHAAGSYGALHYDFCRLDGVRAGSALLGRCKRSRDDGLQRVGYCEATIEDIRWLPAGHTVGYEHPVKLKRPTRVATLAVGYQNGLGVQAARPRGLLAALGRGRGADRPGLRIAGQRGRIIGQVGAMETLVDVTGIKCAAGDWVQLEMDPLFAKGMPRELR